ncbi:MAG: PDZ domain-containing protein [Planctomycetota bacterium]
MIRTPTALALALALATPALAQSDALRRDIDFAREKVYPALVNISVVVKQYSGGRSERGLGAGSGVIVSPAGHVLTNFHVAGHTTRIVCTLPSGERLRAKVLAHDPLTDLSVLKLDLEGRSSTRPLPFATLGKSGDLRVGDYVLAMGNPMGLSSSLTLGVVANTARVFTNFAGTELEEMDLGEGEVTGLFTRWLQHDALILPGNSGGPLVNLRGEVIGINELGGGGMGFAIPSDLASKILNQVLTLGEVRRGWLGFSVMPLSHEERLTGALVSSVIPGSPADVAGVQAGDVVTLVGGDEVSVRFLEQVPALYQRIAELVPGQTVNLLIEREVEGKWVKHTLTCPVARMEPFLGDQVEARGGITVREITAPMALVRRYPDVKGVLVTGLRPGKAFEEAKPPIRPSDVILSVGDATIDGLKGFKAALDAHQGEEVVVSYRRGQELLMTVVDLEEDEPKQQGGELRKAWLGVQTQVLTTPLAKALGIEGTRGFRVTQVLPTTEAEKAGLKAGDVITAIDGEELEAYRLRDARELKVAIEDLPIGESVTLTIVPNGAKQPKDLTVVLQESPATASDVEVAHDDFFEVAVRELTFMDRVRYQWSPTQQGVLVTEATSGSWAQVAGLRLNDLLVEVNGMQLASAADFEAAMQKIQEERPDVVRMFVRRRHRTQFVFVEPEWDEPAPHTPTGE